MPDKLMIKPRLCLVGPMIGRNSGSVTTQGERLADLFAAGGYDVISVSALPNRYLRLVDIIKTLIRRRADFDIIILQVFSGPSFVVEDIASLIGQWLGKPIIMVLRGGNLPKFMERYPRWSCSVLRRADSLVAPSDYLAQALLSYGFQAQIIPNVINLATYPHHQRKTITPRLFWMRSFHELYNPEMALRVLARVRSEVPEASLVMGGSDLGLEGEVQRLAARLGLDGAVRFCGFLNMAGKISEGENAEMFINTNRVDNMPVSVVEACAMGLPVVSTNVGGIPHLLTDGETGLLVPSEDDQAMAVAVLRLLRDPDLTGRLSSNGRKLAERSSWEQVRPQWESLVARVMSRQNASPAAATSR